MQSPVTAVKLGEVEQVVATYHSSYTLLDNGTVLAWGGNVWGQLGNGTHRESKTPTAIAGLSAVTSTVMSWGENKVGQIGDATAVEKDRPTLVQGVSRVTAIAVGGVPTLGAHMLALLNNGTVLVGRELLGPAR